ncbi:hypothetical protein PACTADRAFT_46876 [Pachysolen tannophilus NRRL Y-2460]|uniref:Amino acid permease/ SLC12A domain-containing protein n=1 Tax=Pachysolen tannophilus NRRL Y-2460 TaxID=669874 RepID=A0A1E4TP06_PACTA|nr:hypothetical protein PACTADRAFT_46876 [Pachysolen tannophilus NRRL Y-2460]
MASSVKLSGTTTSALEPITSRLSIIQSKATEKREIDPRRAKDEEELLKEIGYKQELHRTFSTFQTFGIAFSIMGLLPSIATCMGTGLYTGASGLVWGWFVSGIFILSIGVGMSELCSSIPTSGGLYYWTNYYSPDSIRVPLSFVIGCSNSVALCAGVCSVDFGFAGELLSAVYISKDGDFDITVYNKYGIFAACLLAHVALVTFSRGKTAAVQSVSSYANIGICLLFFIAVPIGTKINMGGFNDGKFIFGDMENYGGWSNTGWEFCNGWMVCIWTIGGFDSCVHMSEEANSTGFSIPIGIIGSISICWIVGFFICITLGACMSTDVDSVIDTGSGEAIAQIIYDSLGKKWAVAFMSLICICQFMMGASLLLAASRQIWAFSRDDGLPFAKYIKVVNKKYRQPLRATYFAGGLSLFICCLTLAGDTAADALFSLAVAGNYLAWTTPIFLRLTVGREKFKPGAFYLGPIFSPIVNWIAVFWTAFVIILCMFPSSSSVTASTMNYTVVINPGVWVLSILFYFTYKYKYYHGPKSNLQDPTAEDIAELERIKHQKTKEVALVKVSSRDASSNSDSVV